MILKNTEEQAAKDDNIAEVSTDDGDTGFGIKISSIASTASENQNDEDTGDKEPAAGFGIKISSIASTASEEVETGSKDAPDATAKETEASKDTTEAGPKTTGTFFGTSYVVLTLRGHSTTTWTRRGEGGSAKSPRLSTQGGGGLWMSTWTKVLKKGIENHGK